MKERKVDMGEAALLLSITSDDPLCSLPLLLLLIRWHLSFSFPSNYQIDFKFTPSTLANVKDRSRKIPDFVVTGHLDSATCCITQPFTGMVSVDCCGGFGRL